MNLNAETITLLRSAFVLYEEHLNSFLADRPISPETVKRNKAELRSIRSKLFRKSFPGDLDLNELRHLYAALKMFREYIEEDLSNFSSADRELSLSMQKSCNQLLREIRHIFLDAGIEPERFE